MTLTLELTPEQEQRIEAGAKRRNMDAASYAKALLFEEEQGYRSQVPAQAAEEQWSGADLVAYWEREGLIGTRPYIQDSLEHAWAIRRRAERRTRA